MMLRIVSVLLVFVAAGVCGAGELENLRAQAQKHARDNNRKLAYEAYSKLALDPANTTSQGVDDFNQAVMCLRNLNRNEEVDDFREKVIAAHSGNWRMLASAAYSFMYGDHYGYIVAGKYQRGHHRGGGRYVNSTERDRVRALQLMKQAMEKTKEEQNKNELSVFYSQFAQVFMYQGHRAVWALQVLTDIEKLPEFDEPYRYYGGQQGHPVDADGAPVFFKVPASFETAKNDGERWRWLLAQAVEYSPARANEMRFTFAQFLQANLEVTTMAHYHAFARMADDDDAKDKEASLFSLKTLSDDETIVRLATGIKRLKLPDEFNHIKIYQQLADGRAQGYAEQALGQLAQIYEDRQQYPKAADIWRRSIKEYGDRHHQQKNKRLEQITGNWGMFESIMTQPAAPHPQPLPQIGGGEGVGGGAELSFRFRNGSKVTFEAQPINVKALIEDLKAHVKSSPKNLDWDLMQLDNVGYRLVERNQLKYLEGVPESWSMELKPRPEHFDRRVSVPTPLKKGGAYLVTAKMDNGNTCRIVAWVADTTIVKKTLDKRAWYFVADARTGVPIANAKCDFFGYKNEWINNNNHRFVTKEFSVNADADGQALIGNEQADPNQGFQWLVTASDPDGRFAHLGFSGIWYNNYHDYEYNQTKIFGITDRPVYRPKQTVKFKVWLANAKYDMENNAIYANRSIPVRVSNPKGETLLEKSYNSDAYGGIEGQLELDKDATLGVYHINVSLNEHPAQHGYMHAVAFRLEEYKKPEFEVKVDAPSEPVMLGEKITAKINAKYYFGAPVTEAKVKYKVLRYNHSANWYPRGQWDWFYQPGYWWFGCDYPWYPGWAEWGCKRPHFWWWGHPHSPPEVVSENEVQVDHEGNVKVEIDTAVAKAMLGHTDHKYEISAEVTDQSRRTITGSGTVMVARKPFKVYAWVDRGHYRVGDPIEAGFSAQTLDQKPVKGKGAVKLLKIAYDKDGKPSETAVQEWALDTGEQGTARQQMKASEPGQYRVSYKLADEKKHEIEGGYLFVVTGQGFDSSKFRFNSLELITDKREYAPGESARLMINTDREQGTVVLFTRPANGVYLAPKILRLKGKSFVEEIAIAKKDMPNFFVEALTINGARVYSEMREIVVPPESRVLNVDIQTSAKEYKPGEKAKMKIKLTDMTGEPIKGSSTVSIYDKSVEYISGGSNVPEIKSHFWKWRRSHYPQTESTLNRAGHNLVKSKETGMNFLGAFGAMAADGDEANEELAEGQKPGQGFGGGSGGGRGNNRGMARREAAKSSPGSPMAAMEKKSDMAMDAAAPAEMEMDRNDAKDKAQQEEQMQQVESPVAATVRKNFADTAFWAGTINTDVTGIAEIEVPMPQNLTSWKVKVWTMAQGTRVGQGEAEVTTTKNVIVRLQAPRFFTQKDEVVLSANVHNYLKTKKPVEVSLALEGNTLEAMGALKKTIQVDAKGEQRVDWRVKVVGTGEARVRVQALTDEESDAMEMGFPAYIHGIMKMESFAGNIRPEKQSGSVTFNIPKERRVEDTRLEVRYSPTLAGAMVDALPYLAEYPYGCTEQTLSRFLPTVITQKVLQRMNINLKDVQTKITNLNAQEIGDDVARAKQWKRYDRNPVWDEAEVRDMVKAGVDRLTSMQCGDGGWGWFSGWGEKSYPHTTAYVVHGLHTARNNDVELPAGMLERGVQWLQNHQAYELARLKLPKEHRDHKAHADNQDAFIYMVLADANVQDKEMTEIVYRDRSHMSVYALSMLGIAFKRQQQDEKLAMIMQNIEQSLEQDEENQTAWLRMPQNSWWYWYGSEFEAHAYYLKLLSAADPKSEKASRLVKYLLNNRKHATYWNSTRDTALCVESMADYLRASGEDQPDMKLEVVLDGKKAKEVEINASNLFTFDNKLVLTGDQVASGAHTLEFRKTGKGPVYFNVYSSNFTLEDHITKAGLEIKTERKYYKLKRVDAETHVEGGRGQAVKQKLEKYERQELKNLDTLKSGDLVEIELEIESKNDYEYILFEDMKAAGFEPVDVRSGYNGNAMGAYMELRDERVCFFVRALARGKHSIAYRMRAEIPGKFSALPTRASAMYAPELKANSDEIKLNIVD